MRLEVGMLFACVLFMKQMSDEFGLRGWIYDPDKSDPEPFYS